MKTTISTMPKSINSKKNEQHTNAAQTRVNTTKTDGFVCTAATMQLGISTYQATRP